MWSSCLRRPTGLFQGVQWRARLKGNGLRDKQCTGVIEVGVPACILGLKTATLMLSFHVISISVTVISISTIIYFFMFF
jgi:hypothetical protein